jgi:two-component system, cell cycle response regulator DivK
MTRKVLVIEDNQENMYLMKFLLEHNDFAFYGADNGLKGIEMACDILPDLIILDIQLPGMDGYDVAEELGKKKQLAKTPVIAVTSYAMVGDKERAISSGATGYIEKPINPDTFIAEIKRFFT